MWSSSRRLQKPWACCSRWKLAFLLLVGLCILVQLLFIRSLWRESDLRRIFRAKGQFRLGQSPVPASVDMQMRRWIGSEKTELFAPIVELYIKDPTTSDLADIANLAQLQALSIKAGTPAGLKRLGALRELTTLELRDINLDANSLSSLSGCTKLCRVKVVGNITAEALESLKHCESLYELYLEEGDHFDDHAQMSLITASRLAAIAKIPHLKHLMIQAGDVHDTELVGLVRARELETLTVCYLRLQSNAVNVLGRLPRLRQLELRPYDDLDTCVPPPLKGFPSLTALTITNSRITPSFISSLAKFPRLQALSFADCQVDKSVIVLGDQPNLKLLDLDQAKVALPRSRKMGHLNGWGSRNLFIDEPINQDPDSDAPDSFTWEDYFSQPNWPDICAQHGPGFG